MAVDIDLSKLTEDELVDLNNEIVARLRLLRQQQRYERMLAFNAGDRVSFFGSEGQVVSGIVTRFNQKSVTVQTDRGERWRVSPGLLAKTIDVSVSTTPTIELQPLPLFERK